MRGTASPSLVPSDAGSAYGWRESMACLDGIRGIGERRDELRAGVGEAGWTGHCSYSDEARFFSYRRSVHRKEADYGRMISVIRL